MRSLGGGAAGAAAGTRFTELGSPIGTRAAGGTRGMDDEGGAPAGAVDGGRPSAGFGEAAGTRWTEGAGPRAPAGGGAGCVGEAAEAVGTRWTDGAGPGGAAGTRGVDSAMGRTTGTRPTEPAVGEMCGRFTPGGERCTCGAAARMTDVEGAFSGADGIGRRIGGRSVSGTEGKRARTDGGA